MGGFQFSLNRIGKMLSIFWLKISWNYSCCHLADFFWSKSREIWRIFISILIENLLIMSSLDKIWRLKILSNWREKVKFSIIDWKSCQIECVIGVIHDDNMTENRSFYKDVICFLVLDNWSNTCLMLVVSVTNYNAILTITLRIEGVGTRDFTW